MILTQCPTVLQSKRQKVGFAAIYMLSTRLFFCAPCRRSQKLSKAISRTAAARTAVAFNHRLCAPRCGGKRRDSPFEIMLSPAEWDGRSNSAPPAADLEGRVYTPDFAKNCRQFRPLALSVKNELCCIDKIPRLTKLRVEYGQLYPKVFSTWARCNGHRL